MFHVKQTYKVIVIGGGHAGCEAALASARQGVETLLVTLDRKKIAEMSCNPSIGGVGKGQLVKEIDALGGEMGKNADFTGIQFRRLNTRKGSAVQSSRCQSDKRQYALRMQKMIEGQERLSVLEGEVKALRIENGAVLGVQIKVGEVGHELRTDQVVITSGTFMKGLMHCGPGRSEGGRFGEKSSVGLSDHLRELGFTILRLKTGTPPRLLRDSIDFSQMEPQEGDLPPRRFSFSETEICLPQIRCFLTYTNSETHQIIRDNLSQSPLFSGQIKGIGPRYCPSIEDKVVKFPDKPRHQLFFEPESLDSDWIYPNGISTSLPPDVQEAFVKSLPGCRDVQFARHGYAVEYDCIDPVQLTSTLEAKRIQGLFFAGQVNGTSGYEEAAAQGLMAGINAGLKSRGEPAFSLSRAEAYLGVMIDDLIHLGVTEPYRMFTSRAEFRLSLREDNADARLRPYGWKLGLVSRGDYEAFREKRGQIESVRASMERSFLKPTPELQEKLQALGTNPLAAPISQSQLLKRPEIGLEDVMALDTGADWPPLSCESQETLEVEVKYEGYIELQRQEIARLNRMQGLGIPEAFNYDGVEGLSNEIREKLGRNRPKTLADAARISGVTPAALTALLFHLRQKGSVSGTADRSV
jgi:tRNA uridine 5-carboxymethylaminomethyl modification enzyme